MSMISIFSDITSSSTFFWRCFISLVKVSYWSKFHVNIITGSGVMTISFFKRLTRNLEIRNTPVWGLLNIWRLERVRTTKFDTNVSNKILLNSAKCQSYSFYRFWFVKGKPIGMGEGGGGPPGLALTNQTALELRNLILYYFNLFYYWLNWTEYFFLHILSSFARPQVKTLIVKFRLLSRKTSISGISLTFFIIDNVSNTDCPTLWQREQSCWGHPFQNILPNFVAT